MSRTPICLALHGLGGTPEELRLPLAAIRAAGVTTEAPLLPGHGSTEAAYLASCYADWRALALERYRALCARGPVLLLGYSLGGLLALEAVRRAVLGGLPEPVGLIVLSTPLSVAMACLSLYLTITLSCNVGVMTATSGNPEMADKAELSGVNTLPWRATILSWGSKLVNDDSMMSENPLNIDIVITMAIVANASPHIEMADMMLMALCFFLEKV